MIAPSPVPPVHLVTDDSVLERFDFVRTATRLLQIGKSAVALHLRAHRQTAAALHALAESMVRLARRTGSVVLVNDRVDVALAVGAHGAQLRRQSLSVPDARALLGRSAMIGTSVHSLAEGASAAAAAADFVIAGSVFPTPSHPSEPGRGLPWLAGLAALPLPVVAIGGITPARAGEAIAAGAAGVAVLSGVWGEGEPDVALRRYLAAVGSA